MIPDEAMEAAARAMWQRVRMDPWENSTDRLSVEVYRTKARLALEAAAPYMLAVNEPQKEMSTGALIRQLLDETRTDK